MVPLRTLISFAGNKYYKYRWLDKAESSYQIIIIRDSAVRLQFSLWLIEKTAELIGEIELKQHDQARK